MAFIEAKSRISLAQLFTMFHSSNISGLLLESISFEGLAFLNHEQLSPLMGALEALSGLSGMFGKCLIINYVIRYAPKARPVNFLILFVKVKLKV